MYGYYHDLEKNEMVYDKNETNVEGNWNHFFLGLGALYIPYVDPENILEGTFIGPSLVWIFAGDEDEYVFKKSDYHYGAERFYFKLEVGKLWEVAEHYFIGFTIKDAIEIGMYEGSEIGNYIGLYLTIQRR